MFNNNNIFDSKFKRKMSIRRKEKDAKAISRDFFTYQEFQACL